MRKNIYTNVLKFVICIITVMNLATLDCIYEQSKILNLHKKYYQSTEKCIDEIYRTCMDGEMDTTNIYYKQYLEDREKLRIRENIK